MIYLGSRFQRVQFVVSWPHELEQDTMAAAYGREELLSWLQTGKGGILEGVNAATVKYPPT